MKIIKKVSKPDKEVMYVFGIPVKKIKIRTDKISYCFFGINLFSIKKEHIDKLVAINKTRNDKLIQTWLENGFSESLFERLDFMFSISSNIVKENKKLYLIYIGCLVEKSLDEKAIVCAKRYIANFGYDIIETFFPVSKLLVKYGIRNDLIDKSNYIWKCVQHNVETNVFENYLKDKTIAIVGNNGSELGKGKGKEIDKHDVVIRFNNFPNGYEDDYGKKTNIWVRHRGTDILNRDLSSIDLILWNEDLSHNIFWDNNQVENLYEQVKKYPDKICQLENFVYKGIYDESLVLDNPTTGALITWYLHKLVTVKQIDVYGFAFLQDDSNTDFTHYYDDKCKLKDDHNISCEMDFLRQLYFNKKGE